MAAGNQRMSFSVGKWAGDILFLAGVIALNRQTGRIIHGLSDLPADAAEKLTTGWLINDEIEGPMVAQAWFVFEQIRDILEREGLGLDHVVRMEQFLTDIRDYPAYQRVRLMFFPNDPPAGTLVQVAGLLPNADTRLEVQVTASRQKPSGRPWSEVTGRW